MVTGKYDADSATLTAKTTEGYEKVRYQYGDVVDAKVTTAPAALSQEVRYYQVTLTDTGAADITVEVENVAKLIAGTEDGYKFSELLTKEQLAARANDTTKSGYIAVVYVNRNDVSNTAENMMNTAQNTVEGAASDAGKAVQNSAQKAGGAVSVARRHRQGRRPMRGFRARPACRPSPSPRRTSRPCRPSHTSSSYPAYAFPARKA